MLHYVEVNSHEPAASFETWRCDKNCVKASNFKFSVKKQH